MCVCVYVCVVYLECIEASDEADALSNARPSDTAGLVSLRSLPSVMPPIALPELEPELGGGLGLGFVDEGGELLATMAGEVSEAEAVAGDVSTGIDVRSACRDDVLLSSWRRRSRSKRLTAA